MRIPGGRAPIWAVWVCAVLTLHGFAGTAGATPPPCDSHTMYVVAHQDDTLLFQSPALLQDIQSGRCVRTVFVTAGDAGRPASYWEGREEGAEAAYAQMAGVGDDWTASQIFADGHSIRLETLDGDPDVSLAFMRLPGGSPSGEGYESHGFESPTKLWKGGTGGSAPTISSTEAVDGSATYTYQGLIDTLAALIDSFEPRQVVTQNYTEKLAGPDHADHVAIAYFTRAASALYDGPHRLRAFQDYETSSQPQNVFGELLGAKSFAFYTYGVHDDDACSDEVHCASTEYAKWLLRQYVVARETTGVVADAGYDVISSPSTEVTLDGSESSDESGEPLEYEWDQLGGPHVSLDDEDNESPSFTTPSHSTVLTFSLTVKDGSEVSNPDLVKVRLPASDPSPTAVVGPPQTVDSGSPVDLDGSESWDPNALPLQYAWLQTEGPKVTLSGGSSANPSFIAPTGPVKLAFSLFVSNGEQTSSPATVTIEVKGIPSSITSADTADFTTGTADSFTVTTTGSPTAALSKTGTLPEGLTFTDNGDGTATVFGTPAASAAPPTESADYHLTLKAQNSEGSDSQSLTLKVSNPGLAPSFTSADTADFTTGTADSFTVTTSGSPTAALAKSGALPEGLSFTDNGDGTATISGTPAASAAPPAESQPYPLTLSAESKAGKATQPFTLTVSNPGTPPAFTSTDHADFTTGTADSFTVTTTGSPTAALAKSGALPEGLSFTDNGDGTATISGTPAASAAPPGESQSYPLSLKAKNKAGETSQSFTLKVSDGTSPPQEEPPVVPPVIVSPAGPPLLSSPPISVPEITISKTRVQLLIGRPSRHLVKVLPRLSLPVECNGDLPRGAVCRSTARGDVVVEGSRAVRRAGTYGLVVEVGSISTARRLLLVRVRRPG
jgi:LmbE family N-acetylglucosaminyl deacetylase